MTMREGARIYSPGGTLLAAGDAARAAGLVAALELLARRGRRAACYDGLDRRGAARRFHTSAAGSSRAGDLRRVQAPLARARRGAFAGTRFLTRGGLSGVP